LRNGSKHDIYHNPKKGTTQPVPRHNEINEILAKKIIKDLTLYHIIISLRDNHKKPLVLLVEFLVILVVKQIIPYSLTLKRQKCGKIYKYTFETLISIRTL